MNIIEQLEAADQAATPAPWGEKPENKHLTVLMRNNIGALIELAKACSEMVSSSFPYVITDDVKKALEKLQHEI